MGNVKTNEFDILGRLTATYTVNMHGTYLGEYSYTLDALGNRIEIWEGTRNIVYSYDELNRLTTETVTDTGNIVFEASYTYDPTGNRLTKTTLTDRITYSYDANDRLTLETVTDPEGLPLYSRAYTYDSNGNTLSDGTKTYAYDSKNRLISFTDAADTGIYTYDTAGRRLSKTYGGSTTEYLYCTTCRYAQVLEERDDLGNITAEYYIGNDLISREDGAQELSYLYDGHGSVRKLINEYGSTPAQYNYDAYGILLESSGPSSENNDFRYAGEQFDPHLDQYYLRARYYNQNVGRFHTMDDWAGVMSRPLSLNKYNYTESNPVMGVDPSGKAMNIVGLMARTYIAYTLAQIAIPTYFLMTSGKDCEDCDKCENIAVFAAQKKLFDDEDKTYGHWWVEVNYDDSPVDLYNKGKNAFGWWPSAEGRGILYPYTAVRGVLNGAEGRENDIYHGDRNVDDFFNIKVNNQNNPRIKLTSKYYCMMLAKKIETFAWTYSGDWSYPGSSCHNFIVNMMDEFDLGRHY